MCHGVEEFFKEMEKWKKQSDQVDGSKFVYGI